MNWKTWLTVLAAAASLTACGGGGGAGTPLYGGSTTTPTTTASTSSLIVTLSKTSVTNSDTTPVTVTVTAVSASGEVVANAPVSFAVNGGQLTRSAAVTGSDGKLTASVDFSADKSNRVVTITASSGSLSETRSFSVTGVKIASTAVPTVLLPGESGAIDFTVTDANSDPISGMAISVSSPAGSASSTTSGTGVYRYSYTVPPSYTGTSFVATVTAGGVSQTQTVSVTQVSTPAVVPAATGTVGSSTLTFSPSVIVANEAGSDANQIAVKFKVYDTLSNPMQNVRVSFDENAITPAKGRFSSGSAFVYTDANGEATVSYIPSVTTGPNALVLRACYSKTDFTPNSSGTATTGTAACPAAATQSGTIVKDAFNVTIGPDDTIEESTDGLRYVVKYVVQVANAAGQAKANVQITPTLDLLGYQKGYWEKATSGANTGKWGQVLTLTGGQTYVDPDNSAQTYPGCKNEDQNRNGINDGATEDVDSDNVLEPRKSDAAISFIDPAQTKTDSTGAVGLQVTYLKNVASWLRIKIYVTGSVSGTEGKGTFEEVLAVPAGTDTRTTTPVFANNPYGAGSSCTDN